MNGLRISILGLALACPAIALGAAPAAPSYVEVERAIGRIQADWAKPGAPAEPNAPGWNAFFDAMKGDLKLYGAAPDEKVQLNALGRLYQMWQALAQTNWAPTAEVRDALSAWLTPRVTLAWAGRQLREAVSALPASADPAAPGPKEGWTRFVNQDLGIALREYETAPNVSVRQAGLKKVYGALAALEKTPAWGPTQSLQSALNALYNRPNMRATADVNSLYPKLARQVITTGPVYRKGNVAWVTAGAYGGFGLLPSQDGIAFYNKQFFSSVADVNNFNGQMAADPQGRKATKLYYFTARTTDAGEVTAVAVLRPTGLTLATDSTHNADARIGSAPTQGHGLGRAFAGMLGQNQATITEKVYEGAVPKIRSSVAEESREEAAERLAVAQAEQNALLRQYLPGDGSLYVRNILISGLALQSQPQYALVGGTVRWRGADEQVGASAPMPGNFAAFQPGISADVHLSSVMTNLARGYLQSPDAKDVKNLMIVTHKVPEGAPAKDGVEVSQNVDWETFSKAIDTARAANDPKVMAIRVKRPGRSPEFSADRDGNLVAILHDFAIEVPAPAQVPRLGGIPPARIYRVEVPNAELSISFKIEPPSATSPMRLSGRVAAFDAGSGGRVFAIDADENKAVELNGLATQFVLGAFGLKLRGQPIDVPLAGVNLPGFALSSVSPLDPSGWIRVGLTPTP